MAGPGCGASPRSPVGTHGASGRWAAELPAGYGSSIARYGGWRSLVAVVAAAWSGPERRRSLMHPDEALGYCSVSAPGRADSPVEICHYGRSIYPRPRTADHAIAQCQHTIPRHPRKPVHRLRRISQLLAPVPTGWSPVESLHPQIPSERRATSRSCRAVELVVARDGPTETSAWDGVGPRGTPDIFFHPALAGRNRNRAVSGGIPPRARQVNVLSARRRPASNTGSPATMGPVGHILLSS